MCCACGACRPDTQIQLPAGLSAKDLLKTAPYNAQNPQTNQVSALATALNPCTGANALCMRAFVLSFCACLWYPLSADMPNLTTR